jgi:Host cell surface-exposed lipoprotein
MTINKRLAIGVGAFVAMAIIGTVAYQQNPPLPATVSVQTSTQPAAQPVETQPAEPAAPVYTVAQEQAIMSAQGYLDSGMGFSRAGLLDQLTSPNGEGFSRRLARFALAHVQVNWNQQAVLSAKSYLSSGMGFSYAELVQQLQSPAGEQFTPAQAQHGAAVAFR